MSVFVGGRGVERIERLKERFRYGGRIEKGKCGVVFYKLVSY